MRFGARLQVTAAVSESARATRLFLRCCCSRSSNAVRHGIATCVEGGTVGVVAERAGSAVVIHVDNPRDPDARVRKGTGLGLDIVRRGCAPRLATMRR